MQLDELYDLTITHEQSFIKISFHARQLHFVTPMSENSSIFREIFHLADGPEKIRENPKLFRRGLDKMWTATTSSKMKQTFHDQFASFSSPSVGIERTGVLRYCGIIRMKQNHWKDLKLSPAGWRDCLSNFFSQARESRCLILDRWARSSLSGSCLKMEEGEATGIMRELCDDVGIRQVIAGHC